MTTLEKKLGYQFQNPRLLETALCHSSYANEKNGQSYERLEFLGDSILGMVVADYLYKHCPKRGEGELTQKRAALVCEQSLVQVSEQLGLPPLIRLGKGEVGRGARPSIRADVVEAVIAAIYLDGGMAPAKEMVTRFLLEGSNQKKSVTQDYKTALQERVQRKPNSSIVYQVIDESGPDHAKEFVVEVAVNGSVTGKGVGHSKKEAEQQAAEKALEQYKQ